MPKRRTDGRRAVSPYGGEAEFATGLKPASAVRVSFINTPDQHWAQLARAPKGDKPRMPDAKLTPADRPSVPSAHPSGSESGSAIALFGLFRAYPRMFPRRSPHFSVSWLPQVPFSETIEVSAEPTGISHDTFAG